MTIAMPDDPASDKVLAGKTILLAEDNPDDRDLALHAFEQAGIGCRIDHCADGQAALDYLFGNGEFSGAQKPALPALVLLDLKLPKIDGIEVLKKIRANPTTCRLPVVILTSSREARDVAACYDHHANSYLRKPLDFLLFVRTARQLGHYWLALNESPPH